MKLTKNNSYLIEILVFIVLNVFLWFFFGYNKIWDLEPFGLHFIRQSDSLAFVSKYYNFDTPFWKPSLYNLESINGNAACEFPILYFISASLYSVFGEHGFILKLINHGFSVIGLYCLFKTAYIILKDRWYAAIIILFFFSSTVFNYYTLNYLPDIPALGCVFIGWYFFFRYKEEPKHLLLAFVFFTFSGLLKPTFYISPLAIICYQVFTITRNKEALRKQDLYNFIPSIISVLLVFSWVVYVYFYNEQNQSIYFTTSIRPIWSMTSLTISETWDFVFNYWYSRYFAHSSFHILVVLAVVSLIFFRKAKHIINIKMSVVSIFVFMGTMSYFILFYKQFKEHDYYFLNILPMVFFLLIMSIAILQFIIPKQTYHYIIKAIFTIIILAGINYSKGKLIERHSNTINKFTHTANLIQQNEHEIEQLHIPKTANIILATDLTPNGGLLFLKRNGWRIRIPNEFSEEKINFYKQKGADYLIVTTKEINYKKPNDIIYKNDDFTIYKLNE